MWWLIAYFVGFVFMFRWSIRFAKFDGEYDWDMDDVADVAALTLISFLVALVWPASIVAGITLAGVKRMYLNGRA